MTTMPTLALPAGDKATSSARADRQLLERYRRGDARALAQIYDAHAPAIAAFLARGFTCWSEGRQVCFDGCREPSELEAALEETFARAFSARARLAYDGASSFEIYLTGIARTVALSKLRARDGDNNTRAVRLADHERVRRALLDLQRAFIAGLDDDERSLLFARVERHATAGLAPLRARKVERTLRTRFVELMHEKSHAEQRLSSRG